MLENQVAESIAQRLIKLLSALKADSPLVLTGGMSRDVGIVEVIRRRVEEERLPVNTSGGQLSAGQAGCAGGMIGLVEAVTQLTGRAGDRQVDNARLAVVTGYGMVLYRYGGCANAVVLEGP